MAGSDVAVLQRRLAETVKQYEGKLATLSVFNDALQKENTKLREELEDAQAPRTATDEEVLELKQEFSRRMASADKDIARLKEKNEQLRNKLNAVNQGGSSTQARLRDREEYISSLQAEGEALARKNGELEATTRKLRTAAKEAEAERERLLARLRQQDELLGKERERLETALAAANQQVAHLQGELDALRRQAQEQISSALKEATRAAQAATDEAARGGQVAVQEAAMREASLSAALSELSAELEAAQQRWSQREEALRGEVVRLEAQLRQQEAQTSEAAAAAAEGTRPLLRQIESMAAAARAQEAAAASAEHELLEQLREAHEARQAAEEAARLAEGRLATAEANVAEARRAAGASARALEQAKEAATAAGRDCNRLQAQLKQAEAAACTAQEMAKEQRVAHEAARLELQERLWEARREAQNLAVEAARLSESNGQASKPSPLPDPAVLPVSTSSHVLDTSPHSRQPEVTLGNAGFKGELDGLFRHSSGEMAAAEGGGGSGDARLRALQRRVQAAEASAERANEELLKACTRAEAAQADARKYQATLRDMQLLEARHNVALEILGERNERIETLEEDVREMKHIFHGQLSSLVDQLNSLRAASA